MLPVPLDIPETTTRELLDRYPLVLIDAYGVLVDAHHALPGAAELIAHLENTGHPYFVVTNDASRSPAACAARYRALGVPVRGERVITSGLLLGRWIRARNLIGAEVVVLGPEDSERYVADAGGIVVPLTGDTSGVRGLVLADESGYPFLPHLDEAMSLAMRGLDQGTPLALAVPNPDLIYPKGPGRWGMASGTMARAIEGALELRHPGDPHARFERLGKPFPPIFEEACSRGGTRSAVMIGDQLETDIRGANAAGIDSALVTRGVSRAHEAPGARPTWLLPSLGLGG